MTRGRAVAYNVLRSLPILINLLGVLLLWAFDALTLRNALIINFASVALSGLITLTTTSGFLPRRPDMATLRLQLSYGWRAAGGTLSQMTLSRFDQFVMVALVEPRELGLYVVAATGASVSAPIGYGIALALFPHVRSSSSDVADDRTRQAVRWGIAASVAVAISVALVAPWGIPILFGEAFAGSVRPLLLLLPGQIALDIANIHASRLEASGRPGAASIGLFTGALVTVVGIPLAVPRFGIEGAAVVTSLSYFCYLLVVWRGRRQVPASSEAVLVASV